ncbi:hypothetical protein D9615_004802 [Tricholomella constricta]|uniref:Uncharacterized protein n=1 Tax=Tricholomella constricta TaxID=117010 RepID=A0A8H5HHF5_9AGAR|nr:hypothetical protein D9615_004802 [Tricholomella constricta]
MNGFAYGITKVATEQLTRTLATEFALNNIPVRVNGIAPGTFATDMTAPSEYWAEAAKDPIPGSLLPAPVLRVGRESELVMTALYLASRGGGYTNGHTILMDGGWAAVNP